MQLREWIEGRCGEFGSDRAPAVLATGGSADRLVRLCWEAPPAGPPVLTVRADTVADAVWSAGGLICDGALSGWEVVVQTADRSSPCALRILGAAVMLPDPDDDCWTPLPSGRDDSELRHVPSAAAMAFKARATELVHPGGCAPGVETFRVIAELP
ncbi:MULTISPECIES: hypothetical protein [unclassified Mycobacterium]|uniref:hypothetical protein n=1 Tax=unclassified Mycobacterium TaxID=2642494 RepID=UPI00040B1DEF|nr:MULTISPECIES: hypothetical protein [unclassified Mycobacterium]